MSSNQSPYAPPVQEFVYQTVNGEGPEPPAVDPDIFSCEARSLPPRHSGAVDIEAEMARREAAAYERGMAEGRNAAREEAERDIAAAKACLAENLRSFEQEKLRYYRRIEGEIVDLALAIARKVLHREAQVDRVVLAGVVRVALEKIACSGTVELRVHPSAAAPWQNYLAQQTILSTVPSVVEDGSLRPDQLVLKASHGSTELGIDEQMKEIEKGFSDLVQQKKRSLRP